MVNFVIYLCSIYLLLAGAIWLDIKICVFSPKFDYFVLKGGLQIDTDMLNQLLIYLLTCNKIFSFIFFFMCI